MLGSQVPGFERFYYVSTAYVAGMQGGAVTEQLHVRPRLINPYQLSKWGAEQALHLLHMKSQVPLTIFRPSVVTGHRRSGWTVRNGFGIYMFIDAARLCRGGEHACQDRHEAARSARI
ncbi:SDR family oxidoreductase [Massilia sp. B-10]|nr:SDR family oxidoreductase [Massilia sp. B-10]